MTFEQFIENFYGQKANLMALSKFKKENPSLYAEYDHRTKRVDIWKARQKHFTEITPKNYFELEQKADALFSLIGEPEDFTPDITEEKTDKTLAQKFNALTADQQADLLYHVMLQGRKKKDGKSTLRQDDFDFLESDFYKQIESDRQRSREQKEMEKQNTIQW